MNSCELVSLVTAISCAIAKCVPKKDLPMIASVLGEIAGTLATIIVQEERISSQKTTNEIEYTDTILTTIPSVPTQ